MGVDTHVTGGAGEGFAFTIGDVLLRPRVSVLLGHAKVDDVDDVGGLGAGSANQEVVGLDITVNEVLIVNSLDPGEHLLGNHDDRLDGEATATVVKEVFERGSEEIDHKNVVEAFLAKVVDIGDARAADKNLVGSILISELGSVTLSRFEFDGNLLVVQQVGSFEDDTKGTLADLLADSIMNPNDVGR